MRCPKGDQDQESGRRAKGDTRGEEGAQHWQEYTIVTRIRKREIERERGHEKERTRKDGEGEGTDENETGTVQSQLTRLDGKQTDTAVTNRRSAKSDSG